MTAPASRTVWRPYDDDALFGPEVLLGFASLTPENADRLTRYLAALVESRSMPVHVAVAFNAVYFGYDLSFGGYVGGPIDFDRFPQARFGETTNALPVGAMVNVTAGASPLYTEVVYKEGAHPELGTHGEVPAWLSGAPAGAKGPEGPVEPQSAPVLSERLVCDFDAFGQETVVTVKQLDRLRRHGRWLDADGHLRIESRYPSHADAQADDLEFYVRYLLTIGRDQLLEGPLPLVLTDQAGEAQLEMALRAALGTIRDALAAVPSLQMWRHYAFTRASLVQRAADPGPLGGADLQTLTSSVSRVGVNTRRHTTAAEAVRYTVVGAWLRDVTGAAAQVGGLGYPMVVCHANTIIGRHAINDRDERGLLAGNTHLRLDDPWQGGGIWRTSLPPTAHVAVEPLTPLGLGWLDSQPAPTLPNVSDEERDLADDGMEVLSVTDSHMAWSVSLRLSHTLDGIAPLPDRVTVEFDAHGLVNTTLRLVLAHDGYELEPGEASQPVTLHFADGRVRLSAVSWPLEFFPGIVLTFAWQRGAPLLRARSTLLESPILMDGIEYEHRYDPAVLTRDAAPGCPRRGHASRTTLTPRERVLRAVRRVGLLAADGTAVLAREALPAAVYGEMVEQSAEQVLAPIIAELVDAGDLTIDVASRSGTTLRWPASDGDKRVEVLVWRPRVAAGRPRQRPAEPIDVMTQYVRTHTVAPFLRRLPPGKQASDEAKAEFRRLLARFGRTEGLPAGYTLVREHVRGG